MFLPQRFKCCCQTKSEVPRKASASRAGLRTNIKPPVQIQSSSNEWQSSGRARQRSDLGFNPHSGHGCVCVLLCSHRPADRPLLQTGSLQTNFKRPETWSLATKRLWIGRKIKINLFINTTFPSNATDVWILFRYAFWHKIHTPASSVLPNAWCCLNQ